MVGRDNRPIKEIRAWAGNNAGTGATLSCNQMRTNTAQNPSMLQQCYRHMGYTLDGQIDWVQDANANRTEYEYDALHRRTHTYFPSKSATGVASATDYEHLTYNALGHTTQKRTRNGDVITYTHDALGRLLDRHVPDAPTHSANGRTVTHSYTHDAWGHIETASHDGQTIAYGYDAIGRVLSQTYAGNRTVGYDWDAANNLERLTWPDGFYVDYFWDENNRVYQARENGSRILADITYDALSRRSAVAYANGTNVTYGHSPRGDLMDHDHGFSGSALSYDFTYNGVGQMLTKTLSDPSYGWVAPSTGTESYAVNGLNQYTDLNGSPIVHDDNGNLTNDHRGRTYTYDAENLLRSVSGLVGGSASYRYHADGSRRQTSHAGTTRTYYYMGGLGYLDAGDTAFAADQEIAAYSGAGTLSKRFIRLPGSIDETFLMIDTSAQTETWAHTDRQGSVVATTNQTGAIQDQYRYSPYGKVGSEGSGGFPFRYTGQRLDPETGLYYYKARYYDPELGRFLQTDPIGYEDQMNLYAYVGNDPVNATDPTGQFGLLGAVIGAAVEVGAQLITEGKVSDWKSVGVSAAVGAVTGGVGGRLATQAIKGTISANRAVLTTAATGGAANGVGTVSLNAMNGETTSPKEAALSVAAGAAGAGAGAKVANKVAANFDELSRSSNLGQGVAEATRSSYVGRSPEIGASLGESIAVEAATNATQDVLRDDLE